MQSNADDRNAIIRGVVVSSFILVLALIGAVAVMNTFLVTPMRDEVNSLRQDIETLKRSNAAHFGQIKSALKKADEK